MNKLFIPVCIGRITGSMSILGSSSIIYNIFIDRNRKLSRPFHRLMLLMSICDVLQSIASVISVTAFPTESDIYGAKGNANSCMAQGFFMLLGLSVPLYNSCLKIYYVLKIRYNMSVQQFSKYEPAFHAIPILVPLFLAITFTACGNISPRETFCYPTGALNQTIILSFLAGCFFIHVISMMCLCWTVISQAMKMKKFTRFGSSRRSQAQQSHIDNDKRETIRQALLYTLTFILTYIFPVISGVYTRGENEVLRPLSLIILSNIFFPLQGFWNFLFYARPGVQYITETNPDKSYLGAIRIFIIDPKSTVNMRRHSTTRRRKSLSITSTRSLNIIADSTMNCNSFQYTIPSSEEVTSTIELDDIKNIESEAGTLGLSSTRFEISLTCEYEKNDTPSGCDLPENCILEEDL